MSDFNLIELTVTEGEFRVSSGKLPRAQSGPATLSMVVDVRGIGHLPVEGGSGIPIGNVKVVFGSDPVEPVEQGPPGAIGILVRSEQRSFARIHLERSEVGELHALLRPSFDTTGHGRDPVKLRLHISPSMLYPGKPARYAILWFEIYVAHAHDGERRRR
ncbi:MAG: hypothetical protein AB7G15_07995 [Alphaproteobacteria bacterium]